jgi:hypothetical protein
VITVYEPWLTDARGAATEALQNFAAAPVSGNAGPRSMTWGRGREGGVPDVVGLCVALNDAHWSALYV